MSNSIGVLNKPIKDKYRTVESGTTLAVVSGVVDWIGNTTQLEPQSSERTLKDGKIVSSEWVVFSIRANASWLSCTIYDDRLKRYVIENLRKGFEAIVVSEIKYIVLRKGISLNRISKVIACLNPEDKKEKLKAVYNEIGQAFGC